MKAPSSEAIARNDDAATRCSKKAHREVIWSDGLGLGEAN